MYWVVQTECTRNAQNTYYDRGGTFTIPFVRYLPFPLLAAVEAEAAELNDEPNRGGDTVQEDQIHVVGRTCSCGFKVPVDDFFCWGCEEELGTTERHCNLQRSHGKFGC